MSARGFVDYPYFRCNIAVNHDNLVVRIYTRQLVLCRVCNTAIERQDYQNAGIIKEDGSLSTRETIQPVVVKPGRLHYCQHINCSSQSELKDVCDTSDDDNEDHEAGHSSSAALPAQNNAGASSAWGYNNSSP